MDFLALAILAILIATFFYPEQCGRWLRKIKKGYDE